MYAVIADGGRQFKVEEGETLDLDYRDVPTGESLTLDRVLAYGDGDDIRIGQPVLAGATVSADVVGPVRGPKLVIEKKRRRKTYHRRTGHRQIHTRVTITKISV